MESDHEQSCNRPKIVSAHLGFDKNDPQRTIGQNRKQYKSCSVENQLAFVHRGVYEVGRGAVVLQSTGDYCEASSPL